MSKICCFTGHRDIPREIYAPLAVKLRNYVENLIVNEGFTDFRAGGAIGFDLMAALVVLELKEKYGHIKLHLVLPHKKQEKYYKNHDKRAYYVTLERADSIKYISEQYHRAVMHQRNRALVNGSELCVAYVRYRHGGSYYTANYARENGVKVVNLARN